MYSGLHKDFRKVSVRLTLWHGILFLVFGIIAFAIGYFIVQAYLLEKERDSISFRLNLYKSEYERGGLESVKSLAAFRKGRAQKAYFLRIADASNRTVYLRDPEDWEEFNPSKLEGTPETDRAEKGWKTMHSVDGDTLMIAYVRLADGAWMEIGFTDEEVRQLLGTIRLTAFWVSLLFFPISIIGGVLLASKTLSPLRQITKVTSDIVEKANVEARIPMQVAGNELDDLVALFNRMLDRIERLIAGMRDSLDNVAHDLRTPLTRIRNKAQHALSEVSTVDDLKEALVECIEETQSASALLNTLMDIAETESGLVPLKMEELNLVHLIDSVMDIYCEVAEEKGVLLEVKLPKTMPLNGDLQALRRIVANLIDNAVKYTPKGGKVTIIGEIGADDVQLVVKDTGIGISQEDLPKVWERLFRGDKSRSERGLGLGLCIVRALVLAHSGEIHIVSELEVGTQVTLRLPKNYRGEMKPYSLK